MGSTISKNTARTAASALAQYMTQTNQNCLFDFNQNQNIRIKARGNSNVTVTIGELKQQLVLVQSCTQENKIDNNVNQGLNQMVQQIANTIVQQFQITGKTQSENILEATASLATSISNTFNQSCAARGSQSQYILIDGADESNVNVYANATQYNMSVTDCLLNDTVVNNAVQRLSQTIEQSASTTIENFIAGIFGPVIAILAIVGVLVFAVLLLRGHNSASSGTVIVNTPVPQKKSISQLQNELNAIKSTTSN